MVLLHPHLQKQPLHQPSLGCCWGGLEAPGGSPQQELLARQVPSRAGITAGLGSSSIRCPQDAGAPAVRGLPLSLEGAPRQLPRAAVEVVIERGGGFQMKTDTQNWILLQRDLERAPGCRMLQCGTSSPGARVALTLTECGDLCSRTGKTDTQESRSCDPEDRQDLGHLACARLAFTKPGMVSGTGWHRPPGSSCRSNAPQGSKPQLCQKKPGSE